MESSNTWINKMKIYKKALICTELAREVEYLIHEKSVEIENFASLELFTYSLLTYDEVHLEIKEHMKERFQDILSVVGLENILFDSESVQSIEYLNLNGTSYGYYDLCREFDKAWQNEMKRYPFEDPDIECPTLMSDWLRKFFVYNRRYDVIPSATFLAGNMRLFKNYGDTSLFTKLEMPLFLEIVAKVMTKNYRSVFSRKHSWDGKKGLLYAIKKLKKDKLFQELGKALHSENINSSSVSEVTAKICKKYKVEPKEWHCLYSQNPDAYNRFFYPQFTEGDSLALKWLIVELEKNVSLGFRDLWTFFPRYRGSSEIETVERNGYKYVVCRNCGAIVPYEWGTNVSDGLCGNCY